MFVNFLKLYVELEQRCPFSYVNKKNLIGWSPEIFHQVFIKFFRFHSSKWLFARLALVWRDCLTSSCFIKYSDEFLKLFATFSCLQTERTGEFYMLHIYAGRGKSFNVLLKRLHHFTLKRKVKFWLCTKWDDEVFKLSSVCQKFPD